MRPEGEGGMSNIRQINTFLDETPMITSNEPIKFNGRAGRPNNGTARTPKFNLLPWHDIDFELTPEFVKGLLTNGGASVVYGESGCGKTFLIADLALHIAMGHDWFGHKVKRGGVIYVAAEAGASMRRRVVAFRKHHHLDIDSDIPFFLLPAPVDLLSQQGDIDELIASIMAVATEMDCDLLLIVVDTLARAMAGGNENAADDMGAFVKSIDRLRKETGAHVLVIHHCGKNAALGMRGHSSLKAAIDTEIEVTRAAKALSVATVLKQRDGEIGEEIPFNLHAVHLGVDEDGDPITSCVVIQPETNDAPKNRRKPLKGNAKAGHDCLVECVAREGQLLATSDYIPDGARGVTLQQFRACLVKAGVVNEDGNPREQEKRIRVTLKNDGYAGVWDQFIWPVT
jgi:hypothetical protein